MPKALSPIVFIICISLTTLSIGCKKEVDSPAKLLPRELEGYTLISDGQINDGSHTVKLYRKGDLKVGFNELAIQVLHADGFAAEHVQVSAWPIFTTATQTFSLSLKQYHFSADYSAEMLQLIFPKPSDSLGQWSMVVAIEHHGNKDLKTDSLLFHPTVTNQSNPNFYQFTYEPMDSDPDIEYYVTLMKPTDPEVGENQAELVVYGQYGTSFTYANYLSIKMITYMPATGDSIAEPTIFDYTSWGGNYSGLIDFPKEGHWRGDMLFLNRDPEFQYAKPFHFEVKK